MESWWDRINTFENVATFALVMIWLQLFYILRAINNIDKNLANAINKFSKLIPPERRDDFD
jgi:hypothetical protein